MDKLNQSLPKTDWRYKAVLEFLKVKKSCPEITSADYAVEHKGKVYWITVSPDKIVTNIELKVKRTEK